MQNATGSRVILLAYAFSIALCSLVLLGAMFLSPSEASSAVFLGLSLVRLVLALGFLSAFLLSAAIFIKAVKDRGWAERTLEEWFGGGRFSRWLTWLVGIGLGLGWIGCFLPAYRAGFLGPHWDRIQPLMVFILVVSIATLAVLLFKRLDRSNRRTKFDSAFWLGLALFLAGLLVLGWMLSSKFGVYAPEDFWYGAGVPVLASQLILAVLGGVLLLLAGRNWESRRKDWIISLLLFGLTAFLWAREPLQRSFLFTVPRPPNEVLYPFADAAAFDAGSQFALIGQGIFIFNNPFTDRPLYLSHLVYLHSLFGQNYELMMAAQAVLFAALVPIIYWIGRSLNLRSVGFAAGLVAMFRGMNAIAASSLIDLASPKMILSDFPAAIGVALVVLSLCEWLRQPDQKPHYAAWVGGAIGLTLMIRPHALVLLVFLPFYALLALKFQWKRWLQACVLIGLGVIAFTLPWELRTVSRGGVMYSSIVTKIQHVIQQRYVPAGEPQTSSPVETGLLDGPFQNTAVLASFYQGTEPAQEAGCSSVLCFVPQHILHNTFTSVLLLPTSPALDDLWHTVKQENSYWRANWDGTLSAASLFLLAVNLFFLSLGIGAVWKYGRLAGLAPLAIFIFYTLANSFGRTSGGRYIVPMDWIVPIYFMAGVLFLIAEAARVTGLKQMSIHDPESQEADQSHPSGFSWRKSLPILLMLFAVGTLVPLSERLHPSRYAGFDIQGTLQEKNSLITKAGLDQEQINAFLASPGAEVLVGRTLFPRSYKMGQGEVSFYFYPYTNMDFPRTGFFLIGPNGQDNILLPGGIPEYLPHAADAIVIGCRERDYVDALMVVVLDERDAVYTRSPLPELACPMPTPVCENNSTCE